MTDLFIQNESVQLAYGLNPNKAFEDEFSKVSIENILFEIFSFIAWWLENIFDLFKTDVEAALRERTPHTLRWYSAKAKAYQHGFALLPESDMYDNANQSDEPVLKSKVVKYSAVEEAENEYGRISLRIKLATEIGSDLAPLNAEQMAGVAEYFNTIRDAGVPIQIESNAPDQLKMVWTVYYNPLLLNPSGSRLDGTGEKVVENAIKTYLKSLPFNGTFALAYITDAVQALPGVVIPKIDLAQYKYGLFDWQNIDTWIVPDAGYLRFNNEKDLLINYIPQSEIR